MEGATAGGREDSGEKTRGLGGWRRGGSGSAMSDEGSHTPMGRGRNERREQCGVKKNGGLREGGQCETRVRIQ